MQFNRGRIKPRRDGKLMAFDPIPNRESVTDERGLVSRVWYQFLYKIFGEIFKRLDAIDTINADHEDRITTLEP